VQSRHFCAACVGSHRTLFNKSGQWLRQRVSVVREGFFSDNHLGLVLIRRFLRHVVTAPNPATHWHLQKKKKRNTSNIVETRG
jgi:hypothetical protein